MRRIFLDTEFTQFRDGQLLSIALVTDEGHEFYVEVADLTRHAQASDFFKDVVIPQFGLVPGAAVRDDTAVGARVANWLRRSSTQSQSRTTTNLTGDSSRAR